MTAVKNFEELIAWQKARALTRAVYEVTRQGRFAHDFALAAQMQRASVSVMSNIAEGAERQSTKEFFRFLSTAKASCAEVCSHLYVALDAGYLSDEVFRKIYGQAREVSRILGGLCVAIKTRIRQQQR